MHLLFCTTFLFLLSLMISHCLLLALVTFAGSSHLSLLPWFYTYWFLVLFASVLSVSFNVLPLHLSSTLLIASPHLLLCSLISPCTHLVHYSQVSLFRVSLRNFPFSHSFFISSLFYFSFLVFYVFLYL